MKSSSDHEEAKRRAREFGGVVLQLIREIGYKYDSNILAREEIAKKAGLTKRVLDDFISGERLHPKPDELKRLAAALDLPSREVIEFVLMGSGFGGQEPIGRVDDGEVINSQLQIMRQIRLPCLLVDVFGNIVAANGAIASLFNINAETIRSERDLQLSNQGPHPASALNLLRVIFDRSIGFRNTVTGHWAIYAKHNIQFFRVLSLRYRNTAKFQRIYNELCQLEDFTEFWGQARTYERDHYSTSLYYEYSNPNPDSEGNRENLSYFTASTMTISRHGQLSLTVYLPASDYTVNVFSKLVKKHDLVIPLASWPD